MNNHRTLSGAERQRRYRQRQKCGRRVFNVELDYRDIERLIDAGLLKEHQGLDGQSIATAISGLVEALDGAKK